MLLAQIHQTVEGSWVCLFTPVALLAVGIRHVAALERNLLVAKEIAYKVTTVAKPSLSITSLNTSVAAFSSS